MHLCYGKTTTEKSVMIEYMHSEGEYEDPEDGWYWDQTYRGKKTIRTG